MYFIQDEIAELAGQRVEAQHLKGEYEKKLAEAKKKTAKIEEVCLRVREEFVVSDISPAWSTLGI
jgi:F0F1-type ATP synthase membrane subunit b/b'